MRPSSSPSEPAEGRGLFDSVLARGGAFEATSDGAWLAALLEVEAALAGAWADVGEAPAGEAEAVAVVCADVGRFSVASLGREAAAGGNPVIPLVRALHSAVGGEAAALVHRGATSQDVLDSAAMLVAGRAGRAVLADLGAAAEAAAVLAVAHRTTPMLARTLLQPATPTTFGLVAAGWVAGLDAASGRLADVVGGRLAAQLGGASGTLAGFGPGGLALVEAFARRLGLAVPVAPWHTERGRLAELAGALGQAAGALGKVALDVVLLAQAEVGEVAESGGPPGTGGSSAMPHKRNPIAAVSARAGAMAAPGLVATLLGAMAQEHQRAAGAWHAEWRPLVELLRAVGSAASWLAASLGSLEVDVGRMGANLASVGAAATSEAVATALAPSLGRVAAHDLVADAVRRSSSTGAPLADVLAAEPSVAAALDRPALDRLLGPAGALGLAPELVDRILAARRFR